MNEAKKTDFNSYSPNEIPEFSKHVDIDAMQTNLKNTFDVLYKELATKRFYTVKRNAKGEIEKRYLAKEDIKVLRR